MQRHYGQARDDGYAVVLLYVSFGGQCRNGGMMKLLAIIRFKRKLGGKASSQPMVVVQGCSPKMVFG